MQIDWLTVVAQLFNFLVLVWLLKRFLYGPITTAIDNREKRISDELKVAQQREQTAADSIADYQGKLAEIDKVRDKMLLEAKAAADAELAKLLEKARAEATEKHNFWQTEIVREQKEFLGNLTETASHSLINILRRSLTDLAGQELETQIIENFVQRIDQLDEQSCRQIRAAATAGEVQIKTTAELDETARERISQALENRLEIHTEIQFGQSPALICGIELRASSLRMAWSIADYLQGMEQQMRMELETKSVAAK